MLSDENIPRQVHYCGETCRDLAWSGYHSMECGILSYLEPSRCLGRLPHLALRVVTKTGLQVRKYFSENIWIFD